MPASTTKPFKLPSSLPVMVLEGCYLLPGGIQPLFIFEERYRRMLEHALDTDRMFCLGESVCRYDVRPITTAGVIASSMRAADGTSQMILHGIQRVRITDWEQDDPFMIASVEPFETEPGSPSHVAELCVRTFVLLEKMKESEPAETIRLLRDLITTRKELEFICDLVAAMVVTSPLTRRAILYESSLVRRFEILNEELCNPSTP